MGELTIRRNRGVNTTPRFQPVEKSAKQDGGTQKVTGSKGFTISQTLQELMDRVGRAEDHTRESRRTLQTGEAVLAEVRESLGRMAKLLEDATDGGEDLQAQIKQLAREIDRMTASAFAGDTRLFLDGEPDSAEALLYSALNDLASSGGGGEMPEWLAKALSQDSLRPEQILRALGLSSGAGAGEILAALMGTSPESNDAAGYLAALYLGAVIAGHGENTDAALEGLRQLLTQVSGGTPLDTAIADLTPFESLADYQAQFSGGTLPGLEDFLSGLLLTPEGELSGLFQLPALLAGVGQMDLELTLDLLSLFPELSLGASASSLGDSALLSPELAAVQGEVPPDFQIGSLEISAEDPEAVSYDEGTLALTGNALLRETGDGAALPAIQAGGGGTVVLQNVRSALFTVEPSALRMLIAGQGGGESGSASLETLLLKGELTLAGGLLRLGGVRSEGGGVLRLEPGAMLEVAGKDGTPGEGTIPVPVVLTGPASLAARPVSVTDAAGKPLQPFDVIWKALLPGFASLQSVEVDGRQARLPMAAQDLLRLWLNKGDQGSPIHSLIFRGKDAQGEVSVRYAFLRWDQRGGAFEEVPPHPNPFSVTGGEAGTDWVYEEETGTLRILSDKVTAISGGSGTGADDLPFSGRLVLADGIGRMTLALGGVSCRVAQGRAFYLGEDNEVTLHLQSGAESVFAGGPGYAGISLGAGSSLAIDSPDAKSSHLNPPGVLTARGRDGGAGIGRDSGGGRDRDSRIAIRGGVITATGEGGGAGIGAGKGSGTGPITISGGTITASGSGGGAGIGGALSAPAGDILIRGGTVTALATDHAAAIGAGVRGSCGSITINGSARLLKVRGGDPGADIGAGLFGTCGEVEVSVSIGTAKLWTRTGISLQMGEETVTLPQFRLSAEALGLKDLVVSNRDQVQEARRTLEADLRWVERIQAAYSVLYDRMDQSLSGLSIRRRSALEGPVRDSLAAATLLRSTRQAIPQPTAQAIRTHGKRGKDDLRQLLK